jgi:hypothetical protein
MKGVLSCIIVISLLLTYPSTYIAYAQETKSKESEKTEAKSGLSTFIECQEKGKLDGSQISTGGSFLGGFLAGFLLGLIGTGIAVAAQSTPEPPLVNVMNLKPECQLAYINAYRSEGQKKKRYAALGGGLIGTLCAVVIILSASSK